MPLSLAVLFFAMQKIEQSRQIEELKATVETKELVISSPVFGSIAQFNVQEGELVKKNQTIAKINILDENDITQIDSDLYSYDESENVVFIKSPTDAVVFTKNLAEKSSIKPQETIITLHPIENTVIKIQVNTEKELESFDSIHLTNQNETFSEPIVLSKRLPVTDKQGNTFYYASLENAEFANKLYSNQKAIVKIRRADKALTGKIEKFFVNAAKNVASITGI